MHSIVLVVITLPACVAALFGFIGREQSVAVSGRLICNGIPASGVKVKLYEKELSKFYQSYCEQQHNRQPINVDKTTTKSSSPIAEPHRH